MTSFAGLAFLVSKVYGALHQLCPILVQCSIFFLATMPDHHLTNGSVFDRSGYLVGTILSVDSLPNGDFLLIVKLTDDRYPGAEATIQNSQIKSMDADRKIVTVDLDHQQITPGNNTTIQLAEERLVVNRRRVKVGEISIRRVVETEIVEVPIRREKLVVEKIGEGDPIVEVKLGEPRLIGNGFAAGSGIDSHTHDLTAIGNLTTIRDAVTFLQATTTLDTHCEKIRVYIFLKQKTGLKATVHQFETSETAVQVLLGLESTLLSQCSGVRLELFLNDKSMLQTYQGRFAQYAASKARSAT
ncbi:MAG: YsnF/AvaK domain-containing protein [Nodosilinea sp.]